MKKFGVPLAWTLVLGSQGWAQTSAIGPVLQAELAFAHLADEKGIRTAFLTWLTDEAKVFTPRMTIAKEQYGPEPGDPGHLAWYPEAMGISAAGDLAWSLGPWTYAMKKGEPILVQGHFLSLWRQQVDGRWKVVADIGVPHGAPPSTIEPFAAKAPPAVAKAVAKADNPAPILRRKEAGLAAAWADQGGLALVPLLASTGQLLRRGAPPLRGEEARKALEKEPSGIEGGPTQLQVAASGDLAWTCGEAGPEHGGASASFLRIWIQEAGDWKVLFDVRLPIPPSKK